MAHTHRKTVSATMADVKTTVARAYAVSTVVFTSAMVAARSLAPSLVTVWWALVLYQVLRLLRFGIKVDAISNVKAR